MRRPGSRPRAAGRPTGGRGGPRSLSLRSTDDLAQKRDEVARGAARRPRARARGRSAPAARRRPRSSRMRGEAADAHVTRGEDLGHRRHPDEVGAERAHHPDLGRRLEGRPEPGRVDAFAELEPEPRRRLERDRCGSRRRTRSSCPGSAARATRRSARRGARSPGGSGGRRWRPGCPGSTRRVDRAAGIRQDEAPHAEAARAPARRRRRPPGGRPS